MLAALSNEKNDFKKYFKRSNDVCYNRECLVKIYFSGDQIM